MLSYTLFSYFYFAAAKFSLLDVLHAEVAAAVTVDLRFVPRGGLVVRAVGVGCRCGKIYKRQSWQGAASFMFILYVCFRQTTMRHILREYNTKTLLLIH